ncbi:hypothetical protein RND71_006692 [Anisodus tanguticus]|uniref:Uncharacterized protein n=1 Tax=Anisodus tanguticus TaxID=243964 RepID=A0AAE1VWD7_9SOLA|nr:hypothetical protein RND71_006692 [Anisodus tanguticus]
MWGIFAFLSSFSLNFLIYISIFFVHLISTTLLRAIGIATSTFPSIFTPFNCSTFSSFFSYYFSLFLSSFKLYLSTFCFRNLSIIPPSTFIAAIEANQFHVTIYNWSEKEK